MTNTFDQNHPIYIDPQDATYNRTRAYYEPDAFPALDDSGRMYFSGANLRVYFDDILIDECDSVGAQLSQNVRPIYGYHSHIWNGLQYGTKLVQGYFRIHLTESAYLHGVLAAVEHNRRRRAVPTTMQEPSTDGGTILESKHITLGETMEDAVTSISRARNAAKGRPGDPTVTWRQIADEYDARRFGYRVNELGGANRYDPAETDLLKIRGLFPKEAGVNEFSYAPRGTHLRSEGFTMSLVYGPVEDSFKERVVWDADQRKYVIDVVGGNRRVTGFVGTVQQLHNVHIIAGPNCQVEADGKPVGLVYTFLSRDIT